MKVEGVVLEADAERFLDEMVEEIVAAFGATREEAEGRVRAAVLADRPGLLPGPRDIVGDHLIYHCSPEHWAKAIWHGRRDYWRQERRETPMTENADQAEVAVDPTHPRFAAKVTWRALILFVIVFAGWQAVRVAKSWIGKTGDSAIDAIDPKPVPQTAQERERALRAEVAALDSKIQARQEALSRLDAAMKTRTISRQDDRTEYNKINEEIVALQGQRADAEAKLQAGGR